MSTNTVVTFTDFSAAADNAVQRAAQLAARLGVPLHLGYSGTACGPERGERLVRLDMRARQLARCWAIDVQPPPGDPRDLTRWLASLGPTALAVVDLATLASPTLRRGWGAQLALLDHGTLPVLLVQRDAGQACNTVLIALHEHEDAGRLGRLTARLVDAQTVEWFDLHDRHRPGLAPAPVDGRVHHHEWPPPATPGVAVPQIRHSDRLSSRCNRALLHGQSKDMVLPVIHQAHRAGADLVATVRFPSNLLERWLGRAYAQRLAKTLGCDVLVCPTGQSHPSAVDARHRLKAGMSAAVLRPGRAAWGRT